MQQTSKRKHKEGEELAHFTSTEKSKSAGKKAVRLQNQENQEI